MKQTETKLRTVNPATEARAVESGIVTVKQRSHIPEFHLEVSKIVDLAESYGNMEC